MRAMSSPVPTIQRGLLEARCQSMGDVFGERAPVPGGLESMQGVQGALRCGHADVRDVRDMWAPYDAHGAYGAHGVRGG